MLFNSIEFLIFLPIAFGIYWSLPQQIYRNLFLIIASYVFYGWWDPRFLSLIVLSSAVDFTLGICIYNSDKKKEKRALLIVSIIVNLGILMYFKYANFFIDSFTDLMQQFGFKLEYNTLKILLPVGISFYTFQTLSYSIDVYRGKIVPTKNVFAFFAYVSFFPQLVAGPIERAVNLLPQFFEKRKFDYNLAKDGMRQILFGFFKKIAIADSCAPFVNQIFDASQSYSGIVCFLGATLFAFQIYCDFSGYSDIAIGTAKLFNFKLMDNFKYPYFSRNVGEFWRRWHVSLSSWFRDYLYIPLGGSRNGAFKNIRNIAIIFVVSGFWHGANWKFVFWGLAHAMLFLPLVFIGTNRKFTNAQSALTIRGVFNMVTTFNLVTLCWVLFRADSMQHAIGMLRAIITLHDTSQCLIEFKSLFNGIKIFTTLFLIAVLIFVEWRGRKFQHALQNLSTKHALRWSVYVVICLITIYSYEHHAAKEFIYFQF